MRRVMRVESACLFCSLPDDLVVDILDHIVAVLNVRCCDDGGMCALWLCYTCTQQQGQLWFDGVPSARRQLPPGERVSNSLKNLSRSRYGFRIARQRKHQTARPASGQSRGG